MPSLLFLSSNPLLQNDLSAQIARYLPEYEIYTEDNNDTIFDIALLDGKNFLAPLREKHAHLPALILISEDTDVENDSKTDSFIYKPVELNNLLNKLNSQINLFQISQDGYLYFNEYELHPDNKEILNVKNGDVTKLTEREVSIIRYLYKAKDKIVSKNELLQNVWEYSSDVTTHTIETHIYRLRKKVEQNRAAQLIRTEEGGYCLIF